uniref:uncharacterized protein LOC122596816 n=1 Tax=Erigeron canadensis TaxID=72917 RepID=UPI001CB8C02C|nr:uncharacterized protein LOC122596816 [Erigeron canadensis]
MSVDEQVAIFLHMLAHNIKNRVIICNFYRSGETISRLFTRVCNAVIRLHSHLLKKPEPVLEDSTDQRWKWFKNCLGALDGTHITCRVPLEEKPRYRTRKNDIGINVLGVCSQDMQFIYVLPRWEGSAADGRVLRDALVRPHGLKVPRPGYYLVDAGYTNGEGFLAPYRGQRQEMAVDPFENEEPDQGTGDNGDGDDDDENITSIGKSNEWTTFRDNLAQTMFESWNSTH